MNKLVDTVVGGRGHGAQHQDGGSGAGDVVHPTHLGSVSGSIVEQLKLNINVPEQSQHCGRNIGKESLHAVSCLSSELLNPPVTFPGGVSARTLQLPQQMLAGMFNAQALGGICESLGAPAEELDGALAPTVWIVDAACPGCGGWRGGWCCGWGRAWGPQRGGVCGRGGHAGSGASGIVLLVSRCMLLGCRVTLSLLFGLVVVASWTGNGGR